MDWGRLSLFCFSLSILEKLDLIRLIDGITLVIQMKNKKCLNHLSFLNRVGALTLSVAETACVNIGALIRTVTLVSSEIALYLHKSTAIPCMEYCYVISWLLLVLYTWIFVVKLQKEACSVDLTLVVDVKRMCWLQTMMQEGVKRMCWSTIFCPV